MRGHHLHFERNTQGFKLLGGVLHGFPVGTGTHDDADKRRDRVGGHWPSPALKTYSSHLPRKTKNHGSQAARPAGVAGHPPAPVPAGWQGPGSPQQGHFRRRGEQGRWQPAGAAAARSAGHPRPQAGVPRRRRHSGAAGRGSHPDRPDRRLPGRMSTLPTPDAAVVAADVARALAEDLGSGDVTAALLPDQADSAYLLCKQDGVIAGRPWFDATHRALDPDAPCWPCCTGAAAAWSAPNAPR
ncbi:hypothetical protein G6F31_014911 [Rhizopus arrhizus]|nr:hypothetical protein G6F31_014911 [Rhizopus arrhizus]